MPTLKQQIYLLVACSLQLAALIGCARIESPTGGPKDITPPLVLESTPGQMETNFKASEIQLTFDEYITLNDPNNEVIISPLPNKNPEFKLRKKSLYIEFEEPLKDSTTYTLYSNDAIKDLNEGNVLKNYSLTFSTGSHIDSAFIEGKVIDAFTLEAVESCKIFVYDSISDSLPFKQKPVFISRTDASGNFIVSGLPKKQLYILAVKDVNSNYMLDGNELLAFSDSLITTRINIPADTTDSIPTIRKDTLPTLSFPLFHPPVTQQQLLSAKLIDDNCFQLIFALPTKYFKLVPSIPLPDSTQFFYQFGAAKDTITFWLNKYPADTLEAKIFLNDSIIDSLYQSVKKSSLAKRKKDQEKNNLKVNSTNIGRQVHYFKPMYIVFSRPVESSLPERITFEEYRDTSFVKITPTFSLDTITRRILTINYDLKQNTKYKMLIPDSTFYDIINFANDTIKYNFTTYNEESYGKLIISIPDLETTNQFIIQLLNEKNVLIEEKIFTDQSTKIVFDHILPKSYNLRLILDDNNNNKWDTGNWFTKLQPEKVYYYKGSLTIRENWDTEIEWKISGQ